MTLPGVGAAAAQALVAASGNWRRFASGDVAASYLGLTPRVHQSANTCHYGRIYQSWQPTGAMASDPSRATSYCNVQVPLRACYSGA